MSMKITQALDILGQLGLPEAQQNERSALSLLALVQLKKSGSWQNLEAPMLGIRAILDSKDKCPDDPEVAGSFDPEGYTYETADVTSLASDWVREVQEGDDLRLRALRGTFDDALKTDIPIAMELVTGQTLSAWLAAQPAPSLAQRMRGAWAFANLLYAVGPFAADVFVRPMRLVDPSGRRIHEALKRFQMLGEKPDVAARPFMRFANG